MILYAVRHAEYENPKKLVPFRMDGFNLSELGIRQAQKLAHFFSGKGIEAIYSSPRERAFETAKIIAESLGLEVVQDSLIDETDSPLAGMPFENFNPLGGLIFSDPRHLKGGENPEDIFDRMYRFILQVVQKHRGSVIFVSHGDPIEFLKKGLSGEDLAYGEIAGEDRMIKRGDAYKMVFDGPNVDNIEKLKIQG